MQNFKIAMIATAAARLTAGHHDAGEPLSARKELEAVQLYNYCRQRKFPPAEQLARKQAETSGEAFAPGIWQASETIRSTYEVFRAVAQALEPFWEEDQDVAAGKDPDATDDDDAPAQIAAALTPAPEPKTETEPEKEDETMEPEPDPDSVDERTKAGQAAMDAAIADATGATASADPAAEQEQEPAPDASKPEPKAKPDTAEKAPAAKQTKAAGGK